MLVLSRYETTLGRSLYLALRELERVQGARALNAVTTPSNPENMAEPLSEAEV
jgi:hypothetical protein